MFFFILDLKAIYFSAIVGFRMAAVAKWEPKIL